MTIELAPGLFGPAVDYLRKPLTIRGAGPGKTILTQMPWDEAGSLVRMNGTPSGSALQSLTVRGGLTGSPISYGSGTLVGGGLFASNAIATIQDVVFEGNTAGFGGGAYALNSSLVFQRCTFRDNTASQDGGGLQAFRGSVTLGDCRFEGNDAGNRGGGLHLVGGTVHEVARTYVVGNGCLGSAGGMSWVPFGDASATLVVRDGTVQGNTAGTGSGGIGAAPDPGDGLLWIGGTVACGNTPLPNIEGDFTDLGGNTICDCADDLTQDGTVTGADLGLLLAAWGTCGPGFCSADLNRDGVVDGADLAVLLNDWGGCA